MLKRIKTLHKLWKLSKKDEKIVDNILTLNNSDIEKIPDKGDGKAVFIADMNQEEYDLYVKDELNGWKHFRNKVKTIFK